MSNDEQKSFNLIERLESLQSQIDELNYEKEMSKIRLSNLRMDMLKMRRDFSIYLSRALIGQKQKKLS